MADNFNMKQFLAENKLGAYSRLKENEGNPLGDYLYQYELDISGDVDDETKEQLYSLKTIDDVKKYYGDERGWLDDRDFKRDFFNLIKTLKAKFPNLAETENTEEGYMGTQYDSSEDMAVDMVKKGLPEEKVEEVSQNAFMVVDRIEEIVSNLARNISTSSNIPTQEKIGLIEALKELKEYVEDLGADLEMNETKKPVEEGIFDIDAQSFGGAIKSDNPEGDALVLRFLKGIAQKFDYPVSHAAMFVKERIKKLGY